MGYIHRQFPEGVAAVAKPAREACGLKPIDKALAVRTVRRLKPWRVMRFEKKLDPSLHAEMFAKPERVTFERTALSQRGYSLQRFCTTTAKLV